MVTGGLLHHLHPRPLAESPYLLCRRSALNRPPFPPKWYAATPSKRGLLHPTLRSVQCVKQEEQPASDGEVVDWVNKAVRDPMVEHDPVTVFRRIVTERRAITSASLAMARAKEEEANLALQTTFPPPFILGSKWPGKFTIAITTALVLLAVATALYFLRSRKDRYEAMESPINGRRKLVKDTVKAPESVLTAMALGAASVSRTKGHVGWTTHDTLHASNGNVVENQRPQGAIEFYPIVNTVALEDMESDLHGKPTFGQMPYSSSIVEEFTPLKDNNVGVDFTEGPWFGQGVNEIEMLAPVEEKELESGKSELEELESEKTEELEAEDIHIESQALPFSNEATALPAEEQLVSEISVGEIEFEAPVFTGMADGEFHGEVVAVAGQPNHDNVQLLDFKVEESQIDGVVAVSSRTAKKLEQIMEEDLITSSETKGAPYDTVCPEQSASLDPNDCQNLDSVANCSPVDASVQASEEDSREDSKKALQAAMPAISIGIGTLGALFGVAGGLQVVGFAALARFISHDFFWAQSRESLWHELNGITDRQKLLEFLAKRNIMRMEREKSNL